MWNMTEMLKLPMELTIDATVRPAPHAICDTNSDIFVHEVCIFPSLRLKNKQTCT